MGALCPNVDNSEYTVNGVPVNILPTDMSWVEDFINMAEDIEKNLAVTPEEQKEIDGNPRAIFAISRKRDRYIREKFDSLFGEGVSDAIYKGNMTTLTRGIPVWMDFLMLVTDTIMPEIEKQQALTKPTLQKYEARFAKYQKKKKRK